ncbi:MAG: RNA methyltransferase [Firmicutes bacterium]|nr:RNA methyltransferase [Bacillota bacterium]
MSIITSSSNKQIKLVKKLHKKKYRWKNKSFFTEGVRSVSEIIKSRDIKIKFILYSASLFDIEGGKDLFNVIDKDLVFETTDNILKEVSDTKNPQGILAVVSFNINELEDILLDDLNFLVILDRVQDPGNMGTIIRTADAMGANGIITTSGCVDVYNPKTIRATMGSIFHMPILNRNNTIDLVNELKSKNISIISSYLTTDKYCYDINFNKNFALVIGNEANGINKEIVDISDEILKIPMTGKAESLNAAIASGIIMYEALKQRQNF